MNKGKRRGGGMSESTEGRRKRRGRVSVSHYCGKEKQETTICQIVGL